MAMEKHFIQEGIIRSELESFLRNELEGAGYSGINIQKTPLATRVILYVEKPPLVIGKKGRRINKLTRYLTDKYKIDNPAIDVQKVENPTLDPNIVARRISLALERGMNRRRVVYKALRAVMYAGARGVEIILAGKIIGKGGRARTEKYLQGYMKKAGDPLKLVNLGSTQAYLKAGVIGVTVKIVLPDVVFPDQIEIKPREEEKTKEVKEKPEETKEKKEKGEGLKTKEEEPLKKGEKPKKKGGELMKKEKPKKKGEELMKKEKPKKKGEELMKKGEKVEKKVKKKATKKTGEKKIKEKPVEKKELKKKTGDKDVK
ncbi:MAG: 30S ribosomal protein S3 [Candidatus Altiarchaeota archaeon]|nr:30S ribosomal protein S3 [Candidatus Altiarchaeota archaeon]